jgi:YidC/Oxa1 family membrane protein insertase
MLGRRTSRLWANSATEQKVMNFGMFHLVSEFLLWSMNGLKSLLGNYAAAIIVLTILIKSALWPLQNKATSSMKRMQLLSPRMTELKEKYKDDPTKMNGELMKLYKQYGVNPFGGCLPMLVQIPIFFGFYSMLGSAIKLRNSHFLWIHDLSSRTPSPMRWDSRSTSSPSSWPGRCSGRWRFRRRAATPSSSG